MVMCILDELLPGSLLRHNPEQSRQDLKVIYMCPMLLSLWVFRTHFNPPFQFVSQEAPHIFPHVWVKINTHNKELNSAWYLSISVIEASQVVQLVGIVPCLMRCMPYVSLL